MDLVTVKCLSGTVSVGELVISTADTDYACLVGKITEINLLGSPEHDTENETDDIHVNFMDAEYSEQRKQEISKMFSALYHAEKRFEDCPLDDVIMAPEHLIRITSVSGHILCKLLESRENAMLFCEAMKEAVSQNKGLSEL